MLRQPKRAALLVYLAVARPRGFHRRDTLLALFWPELDTERARDALNSALRYLRRALGSTALVSRGVEEVGLAQGTLWCDGVAFDELVDAGRAADALSLYEGDLLPGFYLSGAPGFLEWVDSERARLKARAADAARVLTDHHAGMGDLDRAVESARRSVQLVPDDERARRRLMELLAAAGDRAGALRVYEELAAWLRAEFGTEPDRATGALAEAVRNGRTPSPAGAESDVAAPPGTPARQPEGGPGSMPDLMPVPVRAPPAHAPSRRQRWRAIGAATGVIALGIATFAIGRTAGTVAPPQHSRRQVSFSGNALFAAISPDGNTVAYVVQAMLPRREHGAGGGPQHVIVQDLAGGAADTVATFRGNVVSNVEWSPDGTRLLAAAINEAVIVPRRGGQARMIPASKALPTSVFAHWLPDGRRVSLHEPQPLRLLIVDLESNDTLGISLEGPFAWIDDGAWAPDGQRFAFVTESMDSVRWTLRTVTLEGRMTLVVEDSVPIASPQWSRDGDALYFLRETASIWRVPLSARTGLPRGNPVAVYRDLEVLDLGRLYFSLTPDGRRLVYARGAGFSNIWALEPGVAEHEPRTTALTTGTALRWGAEPSPDRRWIAFAQQVGTTAELFRMPIDGGAATQITFGARAWPRTRIAWSPDGRRIAFESLRGGHAKVVVADVDDGEMRTFERTRMSTRPGHMAWAPGTRIAYQRHDHRNVNLLDPETGEEETLVSDGTPGWFFSPRYSPDGERLAVFTYRAPGNAGLLVSSMRSPSGSDLVPGGWPIGWSADARYIYSGRWRGVGVTDLRAPAPSPKRLILAPFREVECSLGRPQPPPRFICAVFDFVSDVWLMESGAPPTP